jgi:hypothetical protein
MNIQQFKTMWQEDGTQLILHDTKKVNDFELQLYAVLYPERTVEYGRHMALVVQIDKKGEIVAHDLNNIIGTTNVTQEMKNWFNQCVIEAECA